MSSVRRDIFSGAYVIVSELRGNRPVSGESIIPEETSQDECVFCPGNEHLTPEHKSDGGSAWQTRYFPNKYPALTAFGDLAIENTLYGAYDSCGKHEILVDTRSHYDDLKDFSLFHVEKVIQALKERFDFYNSDKDVTYIQIFKNRGAKAGATQKHSHWQIIAGNFVPMLQETILKRILDYRNETGNCMYCAVLENELKDGRRVVFENSRFAVIAPYASRFTYETWILPKRHVSSFSELDNADIFYLSEALLSVRKSLEWIKRDMDYNILMMDTPKTEHTGMFHWHIQVLPRLGNLAGYEFSTGSYINHIPPETAAEALRAACSASGGE